MEQGDSSRDPSSFISDYGPFLSPTIKQLDSENLVYEDYREINGQKTLVTIHRVPVLAAE